VTPVKAGFPPTSTADTAYEPRRQTSSAAKEGSLSNLEVNLSNPTVNYALGHSSRELDRLSSQGTPS